MKFLYLIVLFIYFSIIQIWAGNKSVNIDSLISEMTIEEKIGQMQQMNGTYTHLQREKIKKGLIGSFLSFHPDSINIYQKIALTESRLKIPLIFARDVIHGYKTIFPIPLGLAASFNPDLVRETSEIAAEEATSNGIRWTFAPMVDVSRDSRWGRIAESYGEDPLLNARMGVAAVKGFQGKNLSDHNAMAACAKHFIGYGASEAGLDYNTTNIPDRLMHNIYLYPFKELVKSGVASVMSAFNDNDGVPMTANKKYLNDVLRNEYKYDGIVISDWEAVKELIEHGFAYNEKDATLKAISAGVDIEMKSTCYEKSITQLLKDKLISIEDINQSVRRMLQLKKDLGLFDNPYYDESKPKPFYAKRYLEKARQAVTQSVVLLKNDDEVLPVKKSVRRIAVLGPMADAPHSQMGTWVMDGEKEMTRTPLKVMNEKYGAQIEIVTIPVLKNSFDINTENFSQAKELASTCDLIMLFLGEDSFLTGEGRCLANIELQGVQNELLEELSVLKIPIITIVMAGRAIAMEKVNKHSQAIMYAWHPGTMGGDGIVDLLFGDVNPSAKLPVSLPYHGGQMPLYYNHHNTGRPALYPIVTLDSLLKGEKQTSLGYRAAYLDYGREPIFPFGFGLSYTEYKYSDLLLSRNRIRANDSIRISFNIINTGKYQGEEIAQLYIRKKSASVSRPVLELKDFKRVALRPNESKNVSFVISPDMLLYYDINNQYTVESGEYEVLVGTASNNLSLRNKFIVE